MIDAYFFDLDGTLVDTEILWVEATEQLAAEMGHPLTREKALELVYGISWPGVYDGLLEEVPTIEWSLDEMGDILAPYFLKLRDSRDVQIHSSIDLLKKLSETHPVAVVSGSYCADVKAAIDIMDIMPCLRFYLGHEDYHPGKPHPACYLAAAEKLGVNPAACVVFEDSTAGLVAGVDAGMYGVALSRPDRPKQDYSRAHLVLEDLADFDPALLKPRN
jgi:beta-phosphoglucomutase